MNDHIKVAEGFHHATNEDDDLERRLRRAEDSIGSLENSLERTKKENRLLIAETSINNLNKDLRKSKSALK